MDHFAGGQWLFTHGFSLTALLLEAGLVKVNFHLNFLEGHWHLPFFHYFPYPHYLLRYLVRNTWDFQYFFYIRHFYATGLQVLWIIKAHASGGEGLILKCKYNFTFDTYYLLANH